VIVAAQRPEVVLELKKVHPALAEHDRIDLMPLALFITEFEVCPDRDSG
jgi:hypothetical protein